MTMLESYACWICGRSAEEINAVFHVDPPEDAEFAKQASQIAWFKEKFIESAGTWRKSLPKDFKEMDFLFVISNPDQFKAVKIVPEVNDARKLMMDWLVKASTMLRNGEQGEIQHLNMASLAAEERESLVKALDQFEGRWRRRLAKEEREEATARDPAGFQGMSLAEGLEFLIAGGLLYYDIQAMLIQFARTALINSMPHWNVQMVEGRWGVQIPMCDVCSGLVVGLRGPRLAAPAEAEHKVAVPPRLSHKPEPVAPVAAAAAPKRDKADELAEEIPAGASAEYVELVKKLGPAAADAADKTRYLHNHRMKEDWDEMVDGKSEQA
jgi:hypothetical protein